MSTTGVFSVAEQESVISAALNSFSILQFLMGLYTLVYSGTIYVLLSKKAPRTNRWLVMLAISLLYVFCLGTSIIQWYTLHLAVVTDGENRETIFVSVVRGYPVGLFVLFDFFSYGLFVVSDGLLIWRCYHLWGKSFFMLTTLSIFFLAESGLFITLVISAGIFGLWPTPAEYILANRLRSAQLFTSFGTTVVTTSLIAYRLLTAGSYRNSSSKRLLKHLLVVLLESATIYSLVILVYAIEYTIPSVMDIGSALQNEQVYMQVFVSIIGGMAPTVMVARIALTRPSRAEPSTHISGIQFQTHSTIEHSKRCNEQQDDLSVDNAPQHVDGEKKVPILEAC